VVDQSLWLYPTLFSKLTLLTSVTIIIALKSLSDNIFHVIVILHLLDMFPFILFFVENIRILLFGDEFYSM
jgi:hypothetical protein